MEDWDLQAIVRGCTREFADAIMEDNLQYSSYTEDNDSYKLPDDFFETKNTSVLDELDELYKPFYPKEQENKEQKILPQNLQKEQPNVVAANMNGIVPKRRKNQNKKVVKQVKMDDLSLDTWAWRKYGQKPIKGSPYPRSYYRCSSLKGCLARKQVERSNTDPTTFIVSYTSEHSHSHPIRRNTLAGVPKKKSSAITKTNPSTIYHVPKTPPTKKFYSSSTCSPISSTTTFGPMSPLMACLEPELARHGNKGDEFEEVSMMVKDFSLSSFEEILDHQWAY